MGRAGNKLNIPLWEDDIIAIDEQKVEGEGKKPRNGDVIARAGGSDGTPPPLRGTGRRSSQERRKCGAGLLKQSGK